MLKIASLANGTVIFSSNGLMKGTLIRSTLFMRFNPLVATVCRHLWSPRGFNRKLPIAVQSEKLEWTFPLPWICSKQRLHPPTVEL